MEKMWLFEKVQKNRILVGVPILLRGSIESPWSWLPYGDNFQKICIRLRFFRIFHSLIFCFRFDGSFGTWIVSFPPGIREKNRCWITFLQYFLLFHAFNFYFIARCMRNCKNAIKRVLYVFKCWNQDHQRHWIIEYIKSDILYWIGKT